MIRIQPKIRNSKMPRHEIDEKVVGVSDPEHVCAGLSDNVIILLHGQLYITDEQVKQATLHANMNGVSILHALQHLYRISDEEITMMVASIYGMDVYLFEQEISQEAIDAVPADVCKRFGIIPIAKNGDILTIAISDPSDLNLLDSINKIIGSVDVVVSTRDHIQEAIAKYYI